MKTYLRLLALTLIVSAFGAQSAFAQIPRTISFQGVLADATGTLVPDGPTTLTVSIYDAQTGGTALFSETLAVTVVRGVFNAIIGSTGTGIPSTIPFDNKYYLGVKIAAGVELAPRTEFTAVPYALNAAEAVHAKDADNATRADTAAFTMFADSAANLVGGFVRSVNGQQGLVELLGAGATTVTRVGNQFVIRSTDTSSGGIRRIDNFDGSLVIDPPQGPFVTMFIRAEGVQTHHLRDLSVTNAKLALNAIGTQNIQDGAVTNPKIGPNAVTTDKIMDGQVMNADLGADAVTTDKIMDGQVMNADLGADAVTTDKIMDGQVMNADLGADAVTTDKIMDGTIVNQDLANNSVDAAKINTGGAPAGNALLSDGSPTPFWGNPIGLSIPFAGTYNDPGLLWSLTQTGAGGNGSFVINNPASAADALLGSTDGTGVGVLGSHMATTGTSAGVRGESNSQDGSAEALVGVINSSSPGGFSAGVRGINNGTGGLGIGIYGSQGGSGWGVYGTTPSGIGVHGASVDGFGMYGVSTNGTGVYGNSTNGESGRFDITNNTSTSNALTGTTNGDGSAVVGTSTGTGRAGFFTVANAANGSSAVQIMTDGALASRGLLVTHTGFGGAVDFQSTDATNVNNTLYVNNLGLGRGALIQSTNAANTANIIDAFTAGTGRVINARRMAGSGLTLGLTEAIRGDNTDGPGVAGTSNTAVGVYGASASTHGVWGVSLTPSTAGVLGRNDQANGYGVWGQSFGGGIGVYGISQTGIAGQFEITNVASASSTVNVTTNGIGSGVTVQLTNAASGARGIDVTHAGVGTGVFATSVGGLGIYAQTLGAGMYAGRFDGNGVSSNGITVMSGAAGTGVAINVVRGGLIGSYTTMASGGIVPADYMVVLVLDDGTAAAATATLPAVATDGQVIIIGTDDPQGVNTDGLGTTSVNNTRRWVRIGGVWKREF